MKRNKRSDKRILLTGGGTTGHVSVNLALIPHLYEDGWDIYYMGSKDGIERDLISQFDYVNYCPISTGKLRRYLDFENIKDMFRVLAGIFQASNQIRKIKPNIIFSKGGFVSVPVIFGGAINRVPALAHESDLTPGLANKLVQPFVKKIFTTFPETENYIKKGKGEFLGPIIRNDLKGGDEHKGKKYLNIDNKKPNILVMGGSLGAKNLNTLIRKSLDYLLENFNIVHACGKGEVDKSLKLDGYYQLEYINKELRDIIALSDIVISRAGSNAIFEFLYYKKPMILIPLPLSQSRGDQIDNAKSFEKLGFARVLDEEEATASHLVNLLEEVYKDREEYEERMQEIKFNNSLDILYNNIQMYKK